MSKSVLVTGANKGIGLEIARKLGKQGFQVYLSARNKEKGEAAASVLTSEGIETTFVPMDVGDEASIQAAYDQLVQAEVSRLDVLVNNAGILLDENRELLSIPAAEIRATLNTNSLGVLLVTKAFAPLLKKGCRVINVSSGAGSICKGMGTWAPVYSISKATTNAITIQLAHALGYQGVVVNAVCPGWVRTDMGGSAASRSVEKGAETPVWLATKSADKVTGKFFRDKKEIPW
ncbi:MAG: SDR family NAD(P)-dependent oxidoreductase [Bacteroidota bacterium]